MEADVGDATSRGGDRRDDVGGTRPRRVHGDVGESVSAQEVEGVVALVLFEPGAVAEFDERDERVEERPHAGELRLRLL